MFRSVLLLPLVVTMMSLGAAHAEQVTVDVTTRHQVIVGWGTCLISWSLSKTPYADPEWRRAYRDLGLNILRVDMKKDVLVDAGGDMAVPVLLESDLESNISKMNFANPKTKVYGDMAAWLAQNALEPERVKITAAVWSPPHWMKGATGREQHHVRDPSLKKPTPWLSRGNWGDSIGGRLLQTQSNLAQFARYMAAWVKGFELRYGVPIYVASIQNELSFENPFDSTTYALAPDGEAEQWWQYAAALKAVKDEFARQQIATRIMGPHVASVGRRPGSPSGLWQQMSYIEAVREHTDPQLIDFLSFYNSNGYLGTDEDAVKMWAGYYRGKAAVPGDWAAWLEARGVARDGKPIWVSEAGGAKSAWLAGAGGSPGKGAITVAQKMHNALVHANASAYVYWQMSGTNREETEHTLLGKQHIESPTQSKKYSAFKHFSRYIRPGAVRVGAAFGNGKSSSGGKSEYDTFHSLNVSAYLHETDRRLTVVLVNMKASPEPVTVELPEGLGIESLEVYVTSSSASFAMHGDLAVGGGKASLTAPAFSVLTLHGVTAG
jgi:O-glycosyl hydrolase